MSNIKHLFWDIRNGNSNNNTTAGSRSQTPHTTALADLLDQLTEVNTRLQPFLAQYHQLMRNDPVLQTYIQVIVKYAILLFIIILILTTRPYKFAVYFKNNIIYLFSITELSLNSYFT